jgi:pyruvate dehydrogenase E1 component alpha subunit
VSAPIQLLGPDGVLDGAVPDGLDDERLVEMMRMMLLGRRIDQRAISLQRRGKLGTYAPLSGQEAASVGSAYAMDTSTDYLVPQYREQLAMLHFGLPLGTYLLQRYGHPQGAWLPEHRRLYPQQVALAAHLPHATGLAWGLAHQGRDAVVLCHFGDGASSEGDFHESLNLAGVRRAPVVYVCQNNQWAISTPLRLQTAGVIAERAAGYGIAGERVDGNDVLAMYAAASRARRRALDGDGPTLIEAVTYRLGAHTTADDPTRYVGADELETAKRADPITRFRTWLTARELWDDDAEAEALTWIDRQIDEATEVFDAAGEADPDAMFAHVFAEEPPRLRRQRERYERQVRQT